MKACFISLINNDEQTKKDRIKNVKNMLKENKGCDMYLLPEMWNTGFFSADRYKENAESLDGETVTAMSEAAAELNAYVFGGSIIENRGGRLYNTAVLFDRRGNLCGSYSKIHLFGCEKGIITPGDKVCVLDTEFGRAGITVCYDLRFPEQYRKMLGGGAEIFLNCAAWPLSRIKHWELLTAARAVENQALSLSVCSSGVNKGVEYAGVSLAVSPLGEVIKTQAECETVSVNENEAGERRAEFSAVSDIVELI